MKPRVKKTLLFGSVLVGMVFVALVLTGSIRRTVRLTAPEIQTQMRRQFPLEKREFIFAARFTDPTVAIDSKSGRVTLGVITTVTALGMKAATGRAVAEGFARYEPSSGEFFLDSPTCKVTGFEMSGLPVRYRETGSDLIAKGLREYLVRTPLYKLSDKDSRFLIARRVLKSMRVEDDTLLIELGL